MVKNWEAVLSRIKFVLMRRGRSRHEAEDLVQEAWVKLACYERRNPVAAPDAFLMRTALNLSIDAYRASKNHGEHVLLDDEALIDTSPTVEAILLSRERVVRLSECLVRIDAKTREIFIAHRVHGVSYIGIARQHRISVSSVERHVAKAALMITRAMEGWYP